MNAFITAGAGFLLAVLWFDLMFDVQAARWGPGAAGADGGELPEPVLASIASYYARVTTTARPMNRLIAATMLATLAAILVQLAKGNGPAWLPWVSLPLALAPILLAGLRTVPTAVRLGTRRDPPALQSELARSVLGQHFFCFLCIACLIALQLIAG
ncbi:MAG: hypothetical protein ACLQBB_16450 [Solirubrobacteraceae bacterium]